MGNRWPLLSEAIGTFTDLVKQYIFEGLDCLPDLERTSPEQTDIHHYYHIREDCTCPLTSISMGYGPGPGWFTNEERERWD